MWTILLILVAVLYSLSPYDLFPDFIVGWGWLDDLVIIMVVWHILNRLKQKTGSFQNNRAGWRQNDRRDESNDPRQTVRPRDPYAVLGISRNAAVEDIKHAYRLLSSQYHPDKVSHLGEEFRQLAEERFKEIQEAYQAILIQKRR